MRNRLITFLVFGAILVGIGEWDLHSRKIEPIQNFNDWWLELCVANSRGQISDPAVTFVRITDDYKPLDLGLDTKKAAADPDAPKKLTRLDYATILGALKKLNPKLIAFEPVPKFDSKSMFNQTDIEPLKDAALPLPRMTLGAVVSASGEAGGTEYPALSFEGDASFLPEIKRTISAPDRQLLANGDAAFTMFDDDKTPVKGGVARVPLLARQGDKVVASFILHALMNDAGALVDQVKVTLAKSKSTIQIGENRPIPIDQRGRMMVPTHSGIRPKSIDDKKEKKHHYPTLTIGQIHIPGEPGDKVAQEFIARYQPNLDSISNNVVLIGFDRNIDRQVNFENGDQLSRAGLFTRAIATAQSGRFIDWWPYWLRWIAILGLVGFAIYIFSLERSKSLILCGLGALLFIVLLVLIFKATLAWTPPFSFVSLLGLLLIVCAILPENARKPEDMLLAEEEEEDESDATEQVA